MIKITAQRLKNKTIIRLSVSVILLSILQCAICEPLVKVTQGMLRGKEYVTDDGQCYHAYKGVPYAKAPTGHLRFKVKLNLSLFYRFLLYFTYSFLIFKQKEYFIKL